MFKLCSKFLAESSCSKPIGTELNKIILSNTNSLTIDNVSRVSELIQSLGFTVELNSLEPLKQFAVDIWIPEKRVAIECLNIDWTTAIKNDAFNKVSSRRKLELARKNDVHLLQFFSDELNSKWSICSSMISNALGKNTIKLSARECFVQFIDSIESKKFVDENHISGSVRAKRHLALVHKLYGIVAVATTRVPIQKKYGNAGELARMCFLQGVSVRGGASKLLKHVKEIVKEDGSDCLLSYAELRFGEGNVYKTCGFDRVGESTGNYWYSDGSKRWDRFKFRAQPGKSEKIVAEENNVRSVWGAGNNIYLVNL